MACRMRRFGGYWGPPVEGTLPDFPFLKHSSIKGRLADMLSKWMLSLTLVWYILVIGCPQQQFRFDSGSVSSCKAALRLWSLMTRQPHHPERSRWFSATGHTEGLSISSRKNTSG